MTDVAFGDRAAYLGRHDALGEASAVTLPLGEREDLVGRLAGLAARFDPATVIVAGDVVHTFDRVSDRSLGTLAALRDACEANGAALELVAGNHDTALADAWDEPVHGEYVLGERRDRGDAPTGGDPSDHDDTAPRTVVCHGHEVPSTAADRYVIGHVHPTIEIEGDRRPCFLRGKETYRGADLLALPAFTRLAPGVPVNGMGPGAFDSPLVPDADRLAPVVVDPNAGVEEGDAGEPLRFPPLGAFRELL
ncbi:metallophosphoesterase [Halorubrum sp. AD140]|uniref:metallophosphoesterase n=1 Tax=Halorubrum sp. AD140 TaxID=3050073 RepID=UPI002ACC98F9|nr:metallophosphoesterase [Halorubrum sp. AD140]MDZ5811141.1 metallophosphoesterase [Halorubrum sp. AD140]